MTLRNHNSRGGFGDWWDVAVGGASGSYAGDVITTDSYAYPSQEAWQQAQANAVVAIAQSASAAANAAWWSAADGKAQAEIVAAADNAAVDAWRDVTGSVEGYAENARGILSRAAELVSYINPVTAGHAARDAGYVSAAGDVAKQALTAAVPALGLGILSSGTVLLIAGGVLLVILLKR